MSISQKNLVSVIDSSWHSLIGEEFDKDYMHELAEFLSQERKTQTVYPPAKDVFNAFEASQLEKTRVVIIGQDPYHGPGQAHGLCFSVKKGQKVPPSLQNIYKELKADLGISPPNHGCLDQWAQQGILMLNATLTVRASKPKSHYGFGWERFTDKVVEKLAHRGVPMVFVLWGKSAIEKCEHIISGQSQHLVIQSTHPSPFSAHAGFLGSRPFSQINGFLVKQGLQPINWQLDP